MEEIHTLKPTRREAWQEFDRVSKDKRPRVLLAEDDKEMRDLVAAALRKDGYDVIEAADGERLLVRVASTYLDGTSDFAYDLLISDIRMPVYSGLAILEGLRDASWPTPVILMTGFGDDPVRARVEELGAILFDKPFDVDDLRAAARKILEPTGC